MSSQFIPDQLISTTIIFPTLTPPPFHTPLSVPASPLSRPAFALRADNGVERGVSVDQDGTSNVWAIEPKM